MGTLIVNTNEGGSERVNPKTGLTHAVISSIVDLGTQPTKFGDKRQVAITWELPTQTHVFDEELGEQPLWMTKTFTLSLYEKSSLRAAIRGMKGADIDEGDFDIMSLLGGNCMINLIEVKKDGNTYVNIDGYAPLMDGFKVTEPTKHVDFSLDSYTEEAYTALPNWQQEKIAESPEFKAVSDLPL